MRAVALALVLSVLPVVALGQGVTSPSESTQVHGSVALSWYRFDDLTDSDRDLSEPTLRVRLRATRLWGKDWNLRVKFRSRYYDRSGHLGADVPRTEWRNRLYEVSFSYDDPAAPLNLKLGRIVSNAMSGVGYIDGLLVRHRVTESLHWGVFAGTQPDWETSDFQTSIRKYGAFVGYLRGDYSGNRLEATLSAAGEYHGSEISREYLYLRSSYYHGKRWSLYGSLELDVNRKWRRDSAGEDLSLSGTYVTARYRLTEWLSTALSYDNRRNYYTYEMRSRADSLFDDAFRHGVRANVEVRLPRATLLHASLGVRGRESETDDTYSYTVGVRTSRFTPARLSIGVRLAGFSKPDATGLSPSLRVGRSFGGGHSVYLGYGSYAYDFEATDESRTSHWARVTGQFELPAGLYSVVGYEYDWGDDVEGHRLSADLGYRF